MIETTKVNVETVIYTVTKRCGLLVKRLGGLRLIYRMLGQVKSVIGLNHVWGVPFLSPGIQTGVKSVVTVQGSEDMKTD